MKLNSVFTQNVYLIQFFINFPLSPLDCLPMLGIMED